MRGNVCLDEDEMCELQKIDLERQFFNSVSHRVRDQAVLKNNRLLIIIRQCACAYRYFIEGGQYC